MKKSAYLQLILLSFDENAIVDGYSVAMSRLDGNCADDVAKAADICLSENVKYSIPSMKDEYIDVLESSIIMDGRMLDEVFEPIRFGFGTPP